MTVKELINKLQKLDPNKRVVVSGYESGCDDITDISEMFISKSTDNVWYYGKYQYVFWPEEKNYDEVAYLLEYRDRK